MYSPEEYAKRCLAKNPDIVSKCSANPKLVSYLYAKVCENFGIAVGGDTTQCQATLRLIGIETRGLDLDF